MWHLLAFRIHKCCSPVSTKKFVLSARTKFYLTRTFCISQELMYKRTSRYSSLVSSHCKTSHLNFSATTKMKKGLYRICIRTRALKLGLWKMNDVSRLCTCRREKKFLCFCGVCFALHFLLVVVIISLLLTWYERFELLTLNYKIDLCHYTFIQLQHWFRNVWLKGGKQEQI